MGWGRLTSILALATCATGQIAWAQDVIPARAEAGQAASNVTAYKPDFFAEYRPNTALDMVGRLPGFSFNNGSSDRGFSGTSGNVLIDGQRPPSRSDSLASVLSRIPASAVERIDVIRGGAPGIDMQGLPMMANVIRKKDAGLSGSVSAGVQVDRKWSVSPNATVQMQNQSGGQTLEGSFSYSGFQGKQDQFRYRLSPADELLLVGAQAFENDYSDIEATGSWELPLFDGKLRTNAKASHETSDFNGVEQLLIPGGNQNSTSTDTTDSGELGLRYTRSIAGFGVEVVAFQSLSKSTDGNTFDTPDFTSGGGGESESGESILRADVKTPALGDWTFDTGAEAVYNYSDSSSVRILDGQVFALDGDASHVDEVRGEAFGTATWAPSKDLNVEAGMRLELSKISASVSGTDSEKSLNFIKPRVNLSWSPAKGHQFGARAERLVDQLNFNFFLSSASFDTEIFGVGNPDIEPARRWEYEARYERQFGGQNSFVARLVHSELDHIIATVAILLPPDSSSPGLRVQIPRNVAVASRDTLDLSGSLELDGLGLKGGLFQAGVNLQNSQTTDPITGFERSLSNNQDWAWNFTLSQTLDNGAFRWQVFASDFSSSSSYSPQSISVQGHSSNYGGASFTWKPAPDWTIGGSINRIYNLKNRYTFILFDAPRDTGSELYRETSIGAAYNSASISIRKNF